MQERHKAIIDKKVIDYQRQSGLPQDWIPFNTDWYYDARVDLIFNHGLSKEYPWDCVRYYVRNQVAKGHFNDDIAEDEGEDVD